MVYVFSYFLIGSIAAVLMYFSGIAERVALALSFEDEDLEFSENDLLLAVAISGVFLWPVLLISFVVNLLK